MVDSGLVGLHRSIKGIEVFIIVILFSVFAYPFVSFFNSFHFFTEISSSLCTLAAFCTGSFNILSFGGFLFFFSFLSDFSPLIPGLFVDLVLLIASLHLLMLGYILPLLC